MEIVQVKVSSTSDPNKVAGMIAKSIGDGKKVEVQAIGASTVNQAVKSIIVARGYLAPSGINLSCIPAFVQIDLGEELPRTGIKFKLICD